jgi:glycosyltransferase involved in cell wall biosynthesis
MQPLSCSRARIRNGAPLLRILIIAPSLDGGDIGEPLWAFHWAEALSRRAEVTVLASSRVHAVPLAQQLPKARVVTWPEPAFLYQKFERLNAMAKPALPLFHHQVRKWVRAAQKRGEVFDVGHQILPQAIRHTTPLKGLGIPYVIGPLGGGLETPPAFEREVRRGSSLASRLRAIDDFRLRYDRGLRASYAEADLILGVAPYVAEKLVAVGIRQFYAITERGHEGFPPVKSRQANVGEMHMVHVGRCIRTKGLRDVIRAMAKVRDLAKVRLTSAGDGEDLAACKAEAVALGVDDRITFLGKIPRSEVEAVYDAADCFCFPSFREPMGGVFFEAMAHGLPVITAARGGPDFIVDETSGIRIPVETPAQFADDIATAIRKLANDPQLRLRLGEGARQRLRSFGDWEDRADTMIELYQGLLDKRIEKTA